MALRVQNLYHAGNYTEAIPLAKEYLSATAKYYGDDDPRTQPAFTILHCCFRPRTGSPKQSP